MLVLVVRVCAVVYDENEIYMCVYTHYTMYKYMYTHMYVHVHKTITYISRTLMNLYHQILNGV